MQALIFGLFRALAIGLGAGVIARGVMRLAALGAGLETGFTLDASATIVGLFMFAAFGSFLGGLAFRRHQLFGFAIAVASAMPVTLPGLAIGGGTIAESVKAGPAAIVVSVAAAVIIGSLVAIALRGGWRSAVYRRRGNASATSDSSIIATAE